MQHLQIDEDDVPFIPQFNSKSFIYGKVLQRHDKCDQNCLELFEMFPHKVQEWKDYKKMDLAPLEQQDCQALLSQFVQEQQTQKGKRKRTNSKAPIIYTEEHEKNLTNLKNFILVSSSKGATNQEISAYCGLKASQVEYIKKGLIVEEDLDNPFFINKFHIEWIEKFIRQERIEAIFNLQDIYLSFLQRFNSKKGIFLMRVLGNYLSLRDTPTSFLQGTLQNHQLQSIYHQERILSTLYAPTQKLVLGHRGQLKRMWQSKKSQLFAPKYVGFRASSLLGAIGSNGFLNYEQIAGHFDSTRFYQYMVILLEQASHHYMSSNFVVILDNAPIHKGKCMLELYEKFTHLFLPTYTPQFNAIELIWNQVKNYLSKKNVHSCLASHALVHQAFNQITDKSIEGCISHVLQIMLKCINEERERE